MQTLWQGFDPWFTLYTSWLRNKSNFKHVTLWFLFLQSNQNHMFERNSRDQGNSHLSSTYYWARDLHISVFWEQQLQVLINWFTVKHWGFTNFNTPMVSSASYVAGHSSCWWSRGFWFHVLSTIWPSTKSCGPSLSLRQC